MTTPGVGRRARLLAALALVALAALAPGSHALLPGGARSLRAMPDSLRARLAAFARTPSSPEQRTSSFPGAAPFTSRQDGGGDADGEPPPPPPPPPQCRLPGFVAGGTLAGSYVGPSDGIVFADERRAFFRFALGWDAARISAERGAALRVLRDLFGLDENAPGLSLGVVTYAFTLRVATSSVAASQCADTVAYLGGFIAAGENVAYGGAYAAAVRNVSEQAVSGGRVVVPGGSSVAKLFLVVNPGTPQVSKMVWTFDRPSTCDAVGSCSASGSIYNFGMPAEEYAGRADGLFTPALIGGKLGTAVTLATLFPGYFPPV